VAHDVLSCRNCDFYQITLLLQFNDTGNVLLNDRGIPPIQGVPGFFNVVTGAQAAIIGHEILHVMGFRDGPGSNDFSGSRSMSNIVSACHVDNPLNSENWVP